MRTVMVRPIKNYAARESAMWKNPGSTVMFAQDGNALERDVLDLASRVGGELGRAIQGWELCFWWQTDEMSVGSNADYVTAANFALNAAQRTFPNSLVLSYAGRDGVDGGICGHALVVNHDAVTGGDVEHLASLERVKQDSDALRIQRRMAVPGLSIKGGWAAKRALPTTTSFELFLGNAVQNALDVATDRDSFEEALRSWGVKLVEVYEREQAEDGEWRNVCGADGEPVIRRWCYAAYNAGFNGGRKDRMRDSSVSPEFSMQAVLNRFAKAKAAAKAKEAAAKKEAERAAGLEAFYEEMRAKYPKAYKND